MRKISAFISESAAGQALLATLMFCFIFVVLFAGLYKAGLSYIQKEKALRGTDMTALSVGAVYANGLQLVRYSNVALMASLIADVVTYVGTEGRVDLNLRGKIQNIQKKIFGIGQSGDEPSLISYPLLFWLEGLQMAKNNQLMCNWPGFSNGFNLPLLPLPMFLFNPETSDLQRSLIPNMALKFRSAADFMPEFPSDKVFYFHADPNGSGRIIYHPLEEVEPATDSEHRGQMWVKPGLPYQYTYCKMKPVVTPGVDPKFKNSFLGKSLDATRELLKNIQFDVTHADDPHNHTVVVCDQLPSSISKNSGKDTLNFHSLSEIKLVGGGLAAWDIAQPKFKVRLIPFEPQKLPVLRDWFVSIPGLPSAPAIPRIGDILQQGLPRGPSAANPEDIGKMFGIDIPSIPSIPGGF